MPGICTTMRSLPCFWTTDSDTPNPSMRERTVLSARSIASAFLSAGMLCFESSTSSARYVPPLRSRPRCSGTRRTVSSWSDAVRLPRSRRVTLRGNRNQTDTQTEADDGQYAILQGHTTAGREVVVVQRSFTRAFNVNWLLGLGQRETGRGSVSAELCHQSVDDRRTSPCRAAERTSSIDTASPYQSPLASNKCTSSVALEIAERRTRTEVHHAAE